MGQIIPCCLLLLNHHIPSPECVCCSLCGPDKPTPVASEYSPRRPLPPSLLQLVPVTRIEKFCSKRGCSEHHGTHVKEVVSEVVFDQPEGKAGEMEPDGSVLNRRKEEEWLEDTEPYHGARPRTTEFDRPVDEILGATLGGEEENVNFRDIVAPRLHPEQKIRQEEEVQTP